MPVFNGFPTIDRAIGSVLRQTMPDWELLAADDCSTDGGYERLLHWSRQDPRIRVFRTEANRGPGAARNLGLRHAIGKMVAYLDCDDEYYPDYLEHVARLDDKGDVLVFGYDLVRDGDPDPKIETWDPTAYRDRLFAGNLATPLGIAHRRDLWSRVGGFAEDLWSEEDWDFWKRLARTGADFLYLPLRSGLYHVRAGSLSRAPRGPQRQRALLEANRDAGRPLYGDRPQSAHRRQVRKLLFATARGCLDPGSPRVEAMADALDLLVRSGLVCQAFCAAQLEGDEGLDFERLLADAGLPHQARDTTCGPHAARIVYTRRGRVPVTAFRTRSSRPGDYDPEEVPAFLTFFETLLGSYGPDAVLICGVDPIAHRLTELARRRDLPVVLWLDEVLDRFHPILRGVDYCIVPSEFSRRHHWEVLGLDCHVLPPVLDRDRLRVEPRDPRYVTLVDPRSDRGMLVFARIAEQLARRRPDIPLLVAGGRHRISGWALPGPVPSRPENLRTLEIARDLREVYAVTKLLLTPTPTPMAFDAVAAGALINGIPVLASDRGALPEIVGDAGSVLALPARSTSEAATVPDPEEVEPWVEAILRHWDEPAWHEQAGVKALQHAQRWHPDRLGPAYADFFRDLYPQPGPPLVPRPPGDSAAP